MGYYRKLKEREGETVYENLSIPTVNEVVHISPYIIGIDQKFICDPKAVKKRLPKEYISRLRRVWPSGLNSMNKVMMMNTCATSLFQYHMFGMLERLALVESKDN